MEEEFVTLVFDYENKVDWGKYPEQKIQLSNTYYVFPKKRFAEMAYIVNDFKQLNKKVIVFI
mgnify:FL=1